MVVPLRTFEGSHRLGFYGSFWTTIRSLDRDLVEEKRGGRREGGDGKVREMIGFVVSKRHEVRK